MIAMTDPRLLTREERFQAADVDFSTLPEPFGPADSIAEQPVPWDCPPTADWDAGGGDGGAD